MNTNITAYEYIRLKRLSDKEKEFRGLSFGQQVKYVLGTTDYTIMMLGMTSLFMVISGIQFWITDYMV